MTPYDDRDRDRSIALGIAAAALVSIPTLGPLLVSGGEETKRYDTVITPPGYAFAIWAPIFAGCVANAVQHADPRRAVAPANRCSGWPLAAAYTLSALWSVAAQSDRFYLTPVILPAAAGCAALAYQRLQTVVPVGGERLAPVSTGLLLGWTALAATVNLVAGAQIAGASPNGRATVATAAVGVFGVAAAVTATVSQSRHGVLVIGRGCCLGTGNDRTHSWSATRGARGYRLWRSHDRRNDGLSGRAIGRELGCSGESVLVASGTYCGYGTG